MGCPELPLDCYFRLEPSKGESFVKPFPAMEPREVSGFNPKSLNTGTPRMDDVWTYNAQGQVQTEDGPFSNDTITYGYDPLNRKESVTLITDNSSLITNHTYDALGRPETISDGTDAFTYTYDRLSTRIAALTRNGAEIVANTHYMLGRLTYKQNKKPDATTISSYAYQLNDADERTKVTMKDGKHIYSDIYSVPDYLKKLIIVHKQGDTNVKPFYDSVKTRKRAEAL